MIVRGIDYGNVLNASGARGFFGEGYWFHRVFPGLSYAGSTFVAKTTTLLAREGNMPLRSDFSPRELLPRCVVVKPLKGVVLNSVGLSGPGALRLVREWEVRKPSRKPWMMSFMSVHGDARGRSAEIRECASVVTRHVLPPEVGIQLNVSCPNAGLDPSALVNDAGDQLEALAPLARPLFLKVNALFPVRAAVELSRLPCLDGIIVSNTIPWGKLPERIDWKGLFGSDVSPLVDIGGGGLSGKPLLPIVEDWVREAVGSDISCKIVAGGGILSSRDALRLIAAGADAVELGSVSILRPWRVSGIIHAVNVSFRERNL